MFYKEFSIFQYPKGLGPTVAALNIEHAKLKLEKTKFSMYLPEVKEFLKSSGIESVVLFGIEVKNFI